MLPTQLALILTFGDILPPNFCLTALYADQQGQGEMRGSLGLSFCVVKDRANKQRTHNLQ